LVAECSPAEPLVLQMMVEECLEPYMEVAEYSLFELRELQITVEELLLVKHSTAAIYLVHLLLQIDPFAMEHVQVLQTDSMAMEHFQELQIDTIAMKHFQVLQTDSVAMQHFQVLQTHSMAMQHYQVLQTDSMAMGHFQVLQTCPLAKPHLVKEH